MIRCCLCRVTPFEATDTPLQFEPTDLPGSGYRCIDRDACAERVKRIIANHRELAAILESQG